jgi:DNA repair protein RecN (Recombination protein N)
MLVELVVENYAVVERVRVRFHAGLNLLTGETGGGKSIVVDALGLLLGNRASADVVRSEAPAARVSGVFAVERGGGLAAALEAAGIELEDSEIILEREVTAAGKSRAFVNNRPVTMQLLRQIAPFLGDIHGQNEQQALFMESTQRELVDDFGENAETLKRVAEEYRAWRETEVKIEELNRNEQEKLRLLDMWTFQRKEIEEVGARAGEDAELEAERRVLQNATRLEEAAGGAFELLYDSPDSASARVSGALRRVQELVKIDPQLRETSTLLEQAGIAVEEASRNLRDYLGHVENDPARLEKVETRLAALDRVKRKYGGTLEEVGAFGERVRRQIDEVENAEGHRKRLEEERTMRARQYEEVSTVLSERRKQAAARLSKLVEQELKSLAMAGTRFVIAVEEGAAGPSGRDQVRFLVMANRGEELRPIERVASGGELSRLSLALKTSAGAGRAGPRSAGKGVSTLVFDEVDAGIGGAVASSVGRRLKQLSRQNQVLCVTHLAQIAGFADHHYLVSKREKNGRTGTAIEPLDRPARAREIGRMLSGEVITAEAMRQAEQLMEAGSG